MILSLAYGFNLIPLPIDNVNNSNNIKCNIKCDTAIDFYIVYLKEVERCASSKTLKEDLYWYNEIANSANYETTYTPSLNGNLYLCCHVPVKCDIEISNISLNTCLPDRAVVPFDFLTFKNKILYPNLIDNDLYSKILYNVPIVTVDIIIYDKSGTNILLFKRKNEPIKDVYYTIGGRIMKNESLNNASQRKLKEEIGVTNVNLTYCGVIEEIFPNSMYDKISSHCINFLYKYVLDDYNNVEIKLDCQHSEYKWFSIQDKELHPYITKKIDISSNNESKSFEFILNNKQ